jgi:hypothetical protein
LFGDGGSAASAWRPVAGTYDLTATPLYREKGSVMGGTPLTVRFTIRTGPEAARTATAGRRRGGNFFQLPAARLTVSPNPVRDGLTIRFAEPQSGQVLVRVYDILGRKTHYEKDFTLSGQHQVQVNLAGLASRFYLLKVVTGNGRQTVRIGRISKCWFLVKATTPGVVLFCCPGRHNLPAYTKMKPSQTDRPEDISSQSK